MSERDIQKACLDVLNMYGLAVKKGEGAFASEGRYIKLGAGYNNGNGWPEITFVYHHLIFLIEAKTPTGKFTDSQKLVFPELSKHVPIYIFRDVEHAMMLVEYAKNVREGKIDYGLNQKVADIIYPETKHKRT